MCEDVRTYGLERNRAFISIPEPEMNKHSRASYVPMEHDFVELTLEEAETEVPPKTEYIIIEETGTDSTEEIDSKVVEDIYLMAKLIQLEAENQSSLGKMLVGCVVLNRVDSELFPDTISEVIYQHNQFSPVASGAIYNCIPTEESLFVAEYVYYNCGNVRASAKGALFFINKDLCNSSWFDANRKELFTEESHTFYE